MKIATNYSYDVWIFMTFESYTTTVQVCQAPLKTKHHTTPYNLSTFSKPSKVIWNFCVRKTLKCKWILIDFVLLLFISLHCSSHISSRNEVKMDTTIFVDRLGFVVHSRVWRRIITTITTFIFGKLYSGILAGLHLFSSCSKHTK